MNRRVIPVLIGFIIVIATVAVGISYLGLLRPKQESGDLVVNAKAFNGTIWNDIKVQISVDNKTYDTPFRYSAVRFTDHLVQAPSSAPGNYSFVEWETGQKNLSRTVSIDFDLGDLAITAYYSLAEHPTEHPSIYTFEDGFEEGFAAWTGKLVKNGADPALSSSVMRTGDGSNVEQCILNSFRNNLNNQRRLRKSVRVHPRGSSVNADERQVLLDEDSVRQFRQPPSVYWNQKERNRSTEMVLDKR
jgi:hypothetical protein